MSDSLEPQDLIPKVKRNTVPVGMASFTRIDKDTLVDRLRLSVASALEKNPWEFKKSGYGKNVTIIKRLPKPLIKLIITLFFDLLIDMFIAGEVISIRGVFLWGPRTLPSSEYMNGDKLIIRREVTLPHARFSRTLKTRVKEAHRSNATS